MVNGPNSLPSLSFILKLCVLSLVLNFGDIINVLPIYISIYICYQPFLFYLFFKHKDFKLGSTTVSAPRKDVHDTFSLQ
jgi:hypothetical protein